MPNGSLLLDSGIIFAYVNHLSDFMYIHIVGHKFDFVAVNVMFNVILLQPSVVLHLLCFCHLIGCLTKPVHPPIRLLW